MIRTIMQSKKGTNLECILDVEPAGPADEVNVGGKGTRNPEQLQDFWLLQLVLFIETRKREIAVCFRVLSCPFDILVEHSAVRQLAGYMRLGFCGEFCARGSCWHAGGSETIPRGETAA